MKIKHYNNNHIFYLKSKNALTIINSDHTINIKNI